MRLSILGVGLSVALLLPAVGSTQVVQIGSPQPQVTAARATWQVNNEAIIVGGLVYYPTRDIRMFDAQVMSQVGIFDGVPVYADVTAEPFTMVFVPLDGTRVRGYQHQKTVGTIATTPTRSATTSVPVVRVPTTVETTSSGVLAVPTPTVVATAPRVVVTPSAAPAAVGTSGVMVTRPAASTPTPNAKALETIPRPRGTNALWVEFNGGRYYSSGASVSYTPDRFEAIGQARGFTVFRDRSSKTNEIWIAAVDGGPVAPYQKR